MAVRPVNALKAQKQPLDRHDEEQQAPHMPEGAAAAPYNILSIKAAIAACTAAAATGIAVCCADLGEGPRHVESSEDEDVTAAVARSKQRDAGVEALLARINSGKEASALLSEDDEVCRGTSCLHSLVEFLL